MPLQTGRPPADTTETVRNQLQRWAAARRFRTPALSRSEPRDLALAVPHAVYALTIEDAAAGRGINVASLVGWRYLVLREDRSIAAVEVPKDEEIDPERDIQVNEGPFVGATADAITAIESRPELAEAQYELRLLKLVALYIIAIWLHRTDRHGTDHVIPIGQTHPAVQPGRWYSAGEFAESIVQAAREQLTIDTTPRDAE